MFTKTLALLALVAVSATAMSVETSLNKPTVLFAKFKKDFNRVYKSAEEEAKRFAIFVENIEIAAEYQRLDKGAVYTVTQHMDLSREEFAATWLGMASKPDTSDFPVAEDIEGRGDLVVVAHARVLVTGGTHTDADDAKVLHEDVVARAARFRNGRWAQLRTDKATDALYAARTERTPDDADSALEHWTGVADDLAANVTSRAQDVADRLAGALKRNQERETRALREDAERIQKGIRKRIDEIKIQLDEIGQQLWEDEEKVQLERNFELLRRRVDTIRDDIDTEIAAVEARYDDLDTFVMPIALTFLHPEGVTRG